jgi:hypothetical protein
VQADARTWVGRAADKQTGADIGGEDGRRGADVGGGGPM